MCFKMGIPFRGLVHDLSKYSITELKMCKYWTGTGSPHEACRSILGYSPSWIHHYHRNDHHWQYWLDDKEDGGFTGIRMPYKCLIESFCDMVGASIAYGATEEDVGQAVYKYWINKCKGKRIMYEDSEFLLEFLIINLRDLGLKKFIKWYKETGKNVIGY